MRLFVATTALATLACSDTAVVETDTDATSADDASSDGTESESGTDEIETDESGTDESGTDESETDESETSETGETEEDEEESDSTETGGEGCNLGEAVHDHAFAGSLVPDACEDYVFSGRVTGNPRAGVWSLEPCPCDATCPPDPHEFQIQLSTPQWQPTLPACVEIEIEAGMTGPPVPAECVIAGVKIRDEDGDRVYEAHWRYPSWIGSFEGEGYAVESQPSALPPCAGTFTDEYWTELSFVADGQALELRQGDVGTLTLDGVEYEVRVPLAYFVPPSRIDADGEFERLSWMLVRE